MTRSKFHSPLLSQYSGHLVYIFRHFFSPFPETETLQSKKPNPSLYFTKPFQVCFQMQLSFEKKTHSDKSAFLKLCANLVCGEKKEGKKKICTVSLELIFSPTFRPAT